MPPLEISPNPFVGYSIIKYGISRDAHVNITIYNITGQKITTIVKTEDKTEKTENRGRCLTL
ncbi:T9SS type A sorting domain-containing protein [candidate division WOR-3 bacterium]|nr:T9SS type A sorting domain-containing protein [candidate division WOR-3 bacterium]